MFFFALAGLAAEADEPLLRYRDRELVLREFVGEPQLRLLWAEDSKNFLRVISDLTGEQIQQLSRRADGTTSITHLGEYGRRAFDTPKWHAPSQAFFLVSDTSNSEDANLHRLDVSTGKVERLTNFDLLRRFSFGPGSKDIFFAARRGPITAPFCLYMMGTTAPYSQRQLGCDKGIDGEFRILEFYEPVVSPDSEYVAVTVTRNNNRADEHLAILNIQTGDLKVVTPLDGQPRNKLHIIAWKGSELYFVTQDAQAQSLMMYDTATAAFSTLYSFAPTAAQIGNETAFDQVSERLVFEEKRQDQRFLSVFDLEAKEVIGQIDIANYRLSWFQGVQRLPDGLLVIGAQSTTSRDRYALGIHAKDTPHISVLYEPETNSIDRDACPSQIIFYPTFDKLADGSQRLIEGVLFIPPDGVDIRGALIYAHGGPTSRTTTAWNPDIQIPCHLGYIVFGPNPRGSTGFGKGFEDLNNYDWGGGDHLDYEYGRRYLAERFPTYANAIGIYGFSYGGYMTNWALTRQDSQFAFGISVAGPSDLTSTAIASTVGSFIIGEMGDPVANQTLYRDRSPLNYAANLSVPLLLVHGSSDNRVPTSESQRLYAKLSEFNKAVSYVELLGEGHSIQYLANQYLYYQAMFDFLVKVEDDNKQPLNSIDRSL